MPAVLNAANEIAVRAFLEKKISYIGITEIIEKVMEIHDKRDIFTIEEVIQSDIWARTQAESLIN